LSRITSANPEDLSRPASRILACVISVNRHAVYRA